MRMVLLFFASACATGAATCEDCSGFVELWAYGAEGEGLGSLPWFGDAALDPLPALEECETRSWSLQREPPSTVSSGTVSLQVGADESTDAWELTWWDGAGAGAFADGAEFPAFDARDVLTLPPTDDVALPTVIDPEVDLVVRWEPTGVDRVTVILRNVWVDAGEEHACLLEDDGEVVVSADVVADIRCPPDFGFMCVNALSFERTNVARVQVTDGAELEVRATAEQSTLVSSP